MLSLYNYTVKFNQDLVEVFWAAKGKRPGGNDNPSVKQFLENTQALMVQKSLTVGGSSSIMRK